MRFREIQYLPKVTPSLTQSTHLAKFQSQLSYYVLINNCFLRSPGYIQHRTLLLRNTRKSILLSCPIAALNQRLALLLRQSNSEATLHPDSQSCPMGSAPISPTPSRSMRCNKHFKIFEEEYIMKENSTKCTIVGLFRIVI